MVAASSHGDDAISADRDRGRAWDPGGVSQPASPPQPVDIRAFPAGFLPIQLGDDPAGPDGPRLMNQMGRGGLRVTVRAGNRDVHILTAHLKSKLLTFRGGFAPANEDQRARFGSYALYRRAS
jgi:hypothetical protein